MQRKKGLPDGLRPSTMDIELVRQDFMPGTDEGFQVQAGHYLRVLLKRKLLILVIVFCFMAVATIQSFRTKPIYQATATIHIDEDTKVLPYDELKRDNPMYPEKALQMQSNILRSRSLAERVVRALNLDNDASLLHSETGSRLAAWKAKLVGLFSSRPGERPAKGSHANGVVEENTAPKPEFPYEDLLLQNLTVETNDRMYMIKISYNSEDPQLAANVVNTLIDECARLNVETRYNTTQQALKFLSDQTKELKARIEKADEDLLMYVKTHDLPPSDDKRNIILQELSTLNQMLTETKLERIKKDSLYKTLQNDQSDELLPSLLKNGRIADLQTKLADLRQRRAALSERFRPAWPELVQLNAQIQELEQQLRQEKQKVSRSLKEDYTELLEREKMLASSVQRQQTLVLQMQENSIQYNILKRDVDSNKQLYDGLLQRMKEAAITASLSSTNIRIVDRAVVPTAPFKPDKTRNIIYGIVVGLIVGLSLAFLLEYFDDTIKTSEEVNYIARLPVLGVVPLLSSVSRKEKPHSLRARTITLTDGRSPMSEAYKSLRTSLLFSSAWETPRVILVTSPSLGDGKTTSAINTAITLTQINRTVVLLDCDMRKPECHNVLGVPNTVGMSSYLSGELELADVIQRTQIPNLQIITSGPIPPKPADLITSTRMVDLISELSKKFHHVIIDSPPVLMISDAQILASLVNGVVVVVRADKTPKELLRKIKQSLAEVNGRILGVVLNGINARGAGYGYRYQYYTYHSYFDKTELSDKKNEES